MLADHEMVAVYGDPLTPENRTLLVDSRNPNSGVTIEVSRLDVNGSSDGGTTFSQAARSIRELQKRELRFQPTTVQPAEIRPMG